MNPASVDLELRVGSLPLMAQGAWGDLAFSWGRTGGPKEASWSMTATYAAHLPSLVRGAEVSALWGGWPLWNGYLMEPAWNGSQVSLTANGVSRLAEGYLAFDLALNTTDNPTIAVTQAIARGLPWTIGSGVPNVSLADVTDATNTTDGLNTVTALLDAWAKQIGQRWWVDQFKVLRFAADPTEPAFIVTPGNADLGIADDDYASNVVVRYKDSADNAFKSASFPLLTPPGAVSVYERRYGHLEKALDATSRAMSTDQANQLAQSVYTQTAQRPGWTNGLELAYGEILNPAGQPVHPARVAATAAGQVVRLYGVTDEVSARAYTDIVIDEASWSRNDGTVALTPVGLVSRSQEDVLTELLEAMFPDYQA